VPGAIVEKGEGVRGGEVELTAKTQRRQEYEGDDGQEIFHMSFDISHLSLQPVSASGVNGFKWQMRTVKRHMENLPSLTLLASGYELTDE
jgi:hypothetical protein